MWFTKYSAPVIFYPLAGKLVPGLGGITLLLSVLGLYYGLYVAPTDYQQGESYRIIFVHVPSAWMSMFIYMVMAISGAIALAWKTKLSEILASACAPIGASFTLIALVTGALWGKPMWGTYWAWDARLTSELILFFLYIGFMALEASIDDPRRASRAAAILALVGVINIPIIHYSVEWWNTLHQPASITSIAKVGKPSIHPSMLAPLFIMFVAAKFYFFTVVLIRMRALILVRERYARWVKELEEIRQ